MEYNSMNTVNLFTACDPAVVNRFMDGELNPEESEQVRAHMESCPFCRQTVSESRVVGGHLRAETAAARSRVDFNAFEKRVLRKVASRQDLLWARILDFFALKRFYIPAGALAAGMVLYFTVFFNSAVSNGPSAIITSFSGEISSVMILETPGTQQTILWFKEDIPTNDEDHAI